MKLLFLSLLDFESLNEKSIYTDLLRQFTKNGHEVCVVSPVERRKKQKTHVVQGENVDILKLKIGNVQKVNVIEKGISTLTIEQKMLTGIKKYFKNVKFDLILYTTPPITFERVIAYIKKRDDAQTYLLLKDIFPQNAVDINLLSRAGLRGIIYQYFRKKEKKLYQISDHIGCMSPGNKKYILDHNPQIQKFKVEVNPNTIEVFDCSIMQSEKEEVRNKYGIPKDKIVFVYGGNLGKPQGIDFVIECLKTQLTNEKVFFLIVGSGTEYNLMKDFVNEYNPLNVILLQSLPKQEYDCLVAGCDVGMIFLDYRFTVPNFPSRILSYMQTKLPVLAVTDTATDMGEIITSGKFGWWCPSNDCVTFSQLIHHICSEKEKFQKMGENAFVYLQRNYASHISYKIICESVNAGSVSPQNYEMGG